MNYYKKELAIGECIRFICVEDTTDKIGCTECFFANSSKCGALPQCLKVLRKDGKKVHYELAKE